MAEVVTGIWVREVTPNNFLNIERHPSNGPEGGGGALYLEVPKSSVPDVLQLLGRGAADSPDQEFAVAAKVVGAPSQVAPLVLSPKSGGRLHLFQNRQSRGDVRHPAWRSERGFPTAPDDIYLTEQARAILAEIGGLHVYVARTETHEFFAGFLVGPVPDDWPQDPDLREAFAHRGQVVWCDGAMVLEPADAARPFRAASDDVDMNAGSNPAAVLPAPPQPGNAPAHATALPNATGGRGGYASSEHAQAVDNMAMSLAMRLLADGYPDAAVQQMPHNNPGYDILVIAGGQVQRYVEVKGTTLADPRFFMSENERAFSEANAAKYTLLVFYSMDLAAGTATVCSRDGAIFADDPCLQVMQWQGQLAGTGPARP